MGSEASDTNNSSVSNNKEELNAHKVLIIRTKDSDGHLLIGGNDETGYYHSTKYVSFKVPFKEDLITIALSLWDTPPIDFSIDVHDKIDSKYYDFAHGLLCVYNPESMESFKAICEKITWFYKNPTRTPFKDITKVSILLIAHKTETLNEETRSVPQEHAIKYAEAMDIKYLEISSAELQDMNYLYVNMATSVFYKYGELPLQHAKDNGSELVIDKQLKLVQEQQQKSENQDVNNKNNADEDDEKKKEEENDDDEKGDHLSVLSRNRERPNIIDKPSRHRSSHEMPTKKRSTFEMNPVSYRFKRFIEEEVGEPSLYDLFVHTHYDDIRMIEYFTDSMLKQEIGIKDQILRKLFLMHCKKLKKEIGEFRQWIRGKLQLQRYLHVFEANGLITLNMIGQEIIAQHEFDMKLQIKNKKHCAILWNALQEYQSSIEHKQELSTEDNNAKKTKLEVTYDVIKRNKKVFRFSTDDKTHEDMVSSTD